MLSVTDLLWLIWQGSPQSLWRWSLVTEYCTPYFVAPLRKVMRENYNNFYIQLNTTGSKSGAHSSSWAQGRKLKTENQFPRDVSKKRKVSTWTDEKLQMTVENEMMITKKLKSTKRRWYVSSRLKYLLVDKYCCDPLSYQDVDGFHGKNCTW